MSVDSYDIESLIEKQSGKFDTIAAGDVPTLVYYLRWDSFITPAQHITGSFRDTGGY